MNNDYDDLYVHLQSIALKSDKDRTMSQFICFTRDFYNRDPLRDVLFFHMLTEKWNLIDVNTELSVLLIDERRDSFIEHNERRITCIKHHRNRYNNRMLPKRDLIDNFEDCLQSKPFLKSDLLLFTIKGKGEVHFDKKRLHPNQFHKMGMVHHISLKKLRPKQHVTYQDYNEDYWTEDLERYRKLIKTLNQICCNINANK